MADAFVKLYKKMLDWEWYDDSNTKDLFLHCLLKANWKPTRWHGVDLEPGQFITSLQSLAVETHMSIRQVRVALDHLKMTGEVTSKSHSKFRVITVNSWGDYQGNDKQSDKQVTSKRQTNDKQVTTDKEIKERKEKEEVKEYKYYPHDEKLNQAFSDYVAMRKKLKKPMTDKAVELAIKKLEELSDGDNDKAIRIIEQSIMNSWQGLFPLKTENNSQGIDWSKV